MSIQLDLMWAGHCRHPEFMTLRGGSWRSQAYPALFGLIQHPKQGTILFDTGYTPRFMELTRSWPQNLYRWITPVVCPSPMTAASQLAKRGISPEQVRHILVSHFHADHIAGLRDFPRAQFWCFREAYEQVHRAQGWRALLQGFLAGLLPEDFEARLTFVDDQPTGSVPAALAAFAPAFDLFGDRTIHALALPGHVVGQMGVFFDDLHGHTQFLVADACWSSGAFRELRPPNPLVGIVMDNFSVYRQTLTKLHHLHINNADIHIIPSHCREIWHQHKDTNTEASPAMTGLPS